MINGEIKMGINGWYYADNNNADSSYTDFTYTDFTQACTGIPVQHRPVRRSAYRERPVIEAKPKKKSHAGKGIICLVLVMIIVLGAVIFKDSIVGTFTTIFNGSSIAAAVEQKAVAVQQKKVYEAAKERTEIQASYNKTDPAYEVAEGILATLKRDNDVDTAFEIFNWVHSHIYYQSMSSTLSFEDAAYRGFTKKTGDCYVYFACAKMLLDCAGIPNLMVERYPVVKSPHYWNLVQLNGEWYHCDATVYKDHPAMYFMCTDDEIGDKHHEFNKSLYPDRATGSSVYSDSYYDDSAYQDPDYQDDYQGGYQGINYPNNEYPVGPQVQPGEAIDYGNDPYGDIYE